MSDETLFEKIIKRDVPAEILYEDVEAIAFKDINPQAPFHVLVCPKVPIKMLSNSTAEDENLLGRLMRIGASLARDAGFGENFRVVINNGADAGQTVFHLHLHFLAGRKLVWPPG